MITFTHVRDPMLSIWQSAVDGVATKSQGLTTGRAGPMDTLVAGTNALVTAVDQKFKDAEHAAGALPSVAAMTASVTQSTMMDAHMVSAATQPVAAMSGATMDCAKLALQLAQAKLSGDTAEARRLQNILDLSTCDPRWSECVTEFLKNVALHGQDSIPYRTWNSLDKYVITDALPKQATIGIVGDWGTGGRRAADVLAQVAGQKPDIFLHLGDIYYAGTEDETKRCFQDVCDAIIPGVRRFTLAGNHDMYSGGAPYYRLLDAIGQPASFFALRNDDWQLLGMDTGYNDYSPLNVNAAVTSLRQDDNADEVKWQRDKITNNGGRKTVLLSHHQPFSAIGINKQPSNTKLLDQFSGLLDKVAWWLFGHEHNHILFKPYAGVERGRCIGASAIPVRDSENPYCNNFGDNGPQMMDFRLTQKDGLYNLGYAILRLDGAKGVLEHYDYTLTKALYTEQIG